MQPVLDENKPVAVGDEPNGLGRAGSANFHSDSGDDASNSHAYGISLHGDTVRAGPPGQGPCWMSQHLTAIEALWCRAAHSFEVSEAF
jgi:hypothetical protein